jgi:phosphate transport system permease protein
MTSVGPLTTTGVVGVTALKPQAADGPTTSSTVKSRKPRRVRTLVLDDWLMLGGSLLASFALVDIGYLHMLDVSGIVGFVIVWYVAFIALYGAVVATANPRHVVVEKLVTATLYLVAALVLAALTTTVVYIFVKGWRALDHLGFYTHDMAGVSLTSSVGRGGIAHAIVGTIIEVGLAVLFAVPLGIGTAVYMVEVRGPGARLIRTVVEAMTAVSDILAGLFVYAILVIGFHWPKDGLAAAIAIGVTMLPLVARTADVALQVVPGSLREAAMALGANHWKTVRKVVLPAARAGLATAAIVAIARGVGETAVVLVTSGASSFMTVNPTKEPMNSLPLFIYTAYQTDAPNALSRAFGAASVLLAMVLALFVAARWFARDKGSSRARQVLAAARHPMAKKPTQAERSTREDS